MPQQILDSIDKSASVIFYPSSCRYSDEFQNVPYDAVVLNSNELYREEKKGKVYCLRRDNNEVLGILYAKGISVSALIIIRDGCCEGGNYECVAGDGFWGRLMPVLSKNFDLFFDNHRKGTTNSDKILPDIPAQFTEFPNPNFLKPFIQMSRPINGVKAFHGILIPSSERTFRLGKINVRIIRDSIWRDFEQFDLVLVRDTGSTRSATENYLRGLVNEGFTTEKCRFISSFEMNLGVSTFREILKSANEMRSSRVSIMPMANGRYSRIAKEITEWHGEYPQEISFYHLNDGDYKSLSPLVNLQQ